MELPKVLKYKTKLGGGLATTTHRVACVDLPLVGLLRTSAARGPRGFKVRSPAGSAREEAKTRPGPYTPDSSEGRARGNRSSEERERGGKAGPGQAGREGREPSPRAAPGPGHPPTARCSALGSRGCARARAAQGAAGLPSGPLASSRAPRP